MKYKGNITYIPSKAIEDKNCVVKLTMILFFYVKVWIFFLTPGTNVEGLYPLIISEVYLVKVKYTCSMDGKIKSVLRIKAF